MPKNDFDTAWEESRQARRSWTRPDVYLTLLLGSAVGLAMGVMLGAGWFADEGYWTNVYTEALSIVLTVVVIGVINEWRETERRKRDLIRRAGSRSNEIAKDAIDEIRHEGWLTGENGILRDANLERANLSEAYLKGAQLGGANLFNAQLGGADLFNAYLSEVDLRKAELGSAVLAGAHLESANLGAAQLEGANLVGSRLLGAVLRGAQLRGANLDAAQLKGVDLGWARLKNANLEGANLEGANLYMAQLEGANLGGVSLGGANLYMAQLEGANLGGASLEGADLRKANLRDAKIGKSPFGGFTSADEDTILPDGTRYDPKQKLEQWERFTIPAPPNFWEPAWVKEERERKS